MPPDLTDRVNIETKIITVLDNENEVRNVLTRYHRKGYQLRGITRDLTDDHACVHLFLMRPELS